MKKSMGPMGFAVSVVVVFVYLVIINAFVFPMIFPDGPAEKFANAREDTLPLFHLLAFAATAILLTIVVDKLADYDRSIIDGTLAGCLLGLLVALPEHLHLHAMVEATPARQFVPVVWTMTTWAVAGLLIGMIRSRTRRRSSLSW